MRRHNFNYVYTRYYNCCCTAVLLYTAHPRFRAGYEPALYLSYRPTDVGCIRYHPPCESVSNEARLFRTEQRVSVGAQNTRKKRAITPVLILIGRRWNHQPSIYNRVIFRVLRIPINQSIHFLLLIECRYRLMLHTLYFVYDIGSILFERVCPEGVCYSM